jgi:Ca-activated chloride channel family protein
VSFQSRSMGRWRIKLAVFALLCLCLRVSPAFAQAAGTGTNPLSKLPEARSAKVPPEEPDTAIKVNVRLVNVFATVVDDHGAPVASLKKEDFAVYEDGHLQNVAVFGRESGLPLSIVVGIDTSLSTRVDLKLELQSARRFAHEILRPVDGLSLYGFSEYVDQLTPFTPDLKRIDQAIEQIHLGSATALYDALYLGSRALEKRKGRKVMVVITDGGDTVSKVDYAEALRSAQTAEAIVYSIIIVPIENSAGRDTGGEHALIQLSTDTGGKYYYASSLPQLDKAFHQISDELRTQYLLGYYPSQKISDSDFRRIEVKIKGPEADKLTVRHRTGYYTTKSE